MTANGAGDVPAIELATGLDGVQALPLLSAAAGFDRIEGGLKASVQVSGSGATLRISRGRSYAASTWQAWFAMCSR
ncbi:hypothetical protein [Devosia naphthalenivorans]|uniref:hypothetical protein n=1 Tax=Devosia naphthalenivorans TaxID=2082392 RepID=UPI0013B04BC1|nr:hypothetical protein [Devosia naphthalenivorans]